MCKKELVLSIFYKCCSLFILYKKLICSSLFLLCTSWTWSQICWGLRLWRPWGRRVRGPELTSWEDHINRWVWNRTMSQNPGTCCSKQRHERQDISGLYAVQTRPCTDIFAPRKPDYKQTLWCCHGDSLFPLSDGTYWPIVHLVYGVVSTAPGAQKSPISLCCRIPSTPLARGPLSLPQSLHFLPCIISTDRLIDQLMRAERKREREMTDVIDIFACSNSVCRLNIKTEIPVMNDIESWDFFPQFIGISQYCLIRCAC